MKHIFFFILLLLSQFSWAQSQDVEQVIKDFNASKVEWQIPLSRSQTTQGIVWKERKSSLASEGIRTFVAYQNGLFLGVISILNNVITGEISWEGKAYRIDTKKEKIIIKEEKYSGACGVEEDHSNDDFSLSPGVSVLSKDTQLLAENQSASLIPSDGVLRIYRLAMLVDYSAFSSEKFQSDKNRVRAFWAETEVGMNERYMRDLAIKFKVVIDDNLIIDAEEKQLYKNMSARMIASYSTREINQLIGYNKYDIGISLAISSTGENGVAFVGDAYTIYKGAAVAIPNMTTIAHEVGHLFGGVHTFTGRTGNTLQTEPRQGTSVMSYGTTLPRDFFSLISIERIRQKIAENNSYYRDELKTQIVGGASKNPPFGIDTKNNAPVIDRSKIKAKYQLPPQTAFQFVIPATDPDGDKLSYWAHQTDVVSEKNKPSKARFNSFKPNHNPIQRFDPEYFYSLLTQNNAQRQYTAFNSTDRGDFTFWLGVTDADVSEGYINRQHHASRLDVVPVTIEVVPKAKPFRITSIKKTGDGNTAGTKYKLKWDVDENIFDNDSRVRILMSDDFGETWKHIIHPNTENDGEEEIIVPNIELTDEISHGKTLAGRPITSSKGLFRIEVIDHIATATTDGGAVPFNGGFKIKKNEITFDSLPDTYLIVNKNDIPAPHNLTASTTCKRNKGLKIEVTLQKDKTEGNLINRIWEAGDYCGNEAYFSQFIEIKEEETTTTPSDLYHNPTSGDGLKGVVGINTENPKTGSWLTIASHNKGFVITRLTSAQIDALTSQEGMMVFDTEEKCLKIYDGKKWSCFSTPTAP